MFLLKGKANSKKIFVSFGGINKTLISSNFNFFKDIDTSK
jgi:hypothetical protein